MEGFFDDLKDKIVPNGRIDEMRQVAIENKFNFRSKENFAGQDYLLKSFQIFKGKKDKRFKGILRKKENELDALVRIYDYFYWGDLKTRKTTIVEINCLELDLPKFSIYPKGILNQVSSFFVNKEKAFPREENFHAKFNIETEHVEDLEACFGNKMLEQLLQFPNISMEGEGDYLLIYFYGKQIPASELMSHYDMALDLFELALNDNSSEFV